MNKLIEVPEILEVPEVDARLNSPLPKVQLPGDDRLLSAFAADIAEILKHSGLYQRGGVALLAGTHRIPGFVSLGTSTPMCPRTDRTKKPSLIPPELRVCA